MTSVPPHDPLPYGPATPLVRQLLVALSARPTRDWLVLATEFRRRSASSDVQAADRALGRAIQHAGLEWARDAVVGPVLQLAHNVATAHDGAAAAAALDTEALGEAALAAVLAVLASPVLDASSADALYAHVEPIIPRAVLDPGR